ncbi:MAG: hypothetical protein ABIJ37_03250 [Pseudomonadota bacterium]
MVLKEILEKIRLVDIQTTVKDVFKSKQFGLVNIEKNIYNLDMSDEKAKNFIAIKVDEALERKVKEAAIKRLEPIGDAIDLLSASTATSIVASTMTTATLDIIAPLPKITIKGHEE